MADEKECPLCGGTMRLRTEGLREAIDFALRRTLSVADDPHARALALEGTGWEGDLDEMRDEPIALL